MRLLLDRVKKVTRRNKRALCSMAGSDKIKVGVSEVLLVEEIGGEWERRQGGGSFVIKIGKLGELLEIFGPLRV